MNVALYCIYVLYNRKKELICQLKHVSSIFYLLVLCVVLATASNVGWQKEERKKIYTGSTYWHFKLQHTDIHSQAHIVKNTYGFFAMFLFSCYYSSRLSLPLPCQYKYDAFGVCDMVAVWCNALPKYLLVSLLFCFTPFYIYLYIFLIWVLVKICPTTISVFIPSRVLRLHACMLYIRVVITYRCND